MSDAPKKIVYRKLAPEQRRLLLTWIADGLSNGEMRQRAAAHDPPFELKAGHIKHARESMGARWKERWAATESELLEHSLARKATRIRELSELYDQHLQLLRERAADPEMAEVPGGQTGLISLGVREGRILPRYDRGLVAEMRAILDDIAKELGQRQQRIEHSGPAGAPIPVALTDMIETAYSENNGESGETT